MQIHLYRTCVKRERPWRNQASDAKELPGLNIARPW